MIQIYSCIICYEKKDEDIVVHIRKGHWIKKKMNRPLDAYEDVAESGESN